MSIKKFLQDVSYDNICQEAMQALSTDIKFDIVVTIPILKIAYSDLYASKATILFYSSI